MLGGVGLVPTSLRSQCGWQACEHAQMDSTQAASSAAAVPGAAAAGTSLAPSSSPCSPSSQQLSISQAAPHSSSAAPPSATTLTPQAALPTAAATSAASAAGSLPASGGLPRYTRVLSTCRGAVQSGQYRACWTLSSSHGGAPCWQNTQAPADAHAHVLACPPHQQTCCSARQLNSPRRCR